MAFPIVGPSVAAPTHAAFGHLGKQALHEIQPTSASGREVDVIAGVPRQLHAHFADLVGAPSDRQELLEQQATTRR